MNVYLVRTVGGPHPGDRISDGPWPLPDRLPDEGGEYVKVGQSQLDADVPHVMRGAQYEWRSSTGAERCVYCGNEILDGETGDIAHEECWSARQSNTH